jgi:hypothetical protein
MTPALLLPAALAALAALLIPLVIHIARRTESRTVAFAALRWLNPSPAPRRRLRINELWLLAVRLLLLAAIALWLARPVLWNAEKDVRVIAIAPGLNPAAIEATAGEDDRLLWLAPSFPAISDAPPATPANLISLIRQLDSELPPKTEVEIVVPAVLDGVDAERPRLTRRVRWRVVEGPAPPSAPPLQPPSLTVRFSPTAADSVRFFRAAATAWAAPGTSPAFDAAPVERPIDAEARHLVWLAEGPLPDTVIRWIEAGGTAMLMQGARLPVEDSEVAWSDPLGEPLAFASRFGAGRVLRLTRPLEVAAIPQLLDPRFPDDLMDMLEPVPPPARIAAAQHAPLIGARPYPRPPLELRDWLALLIALIFGLERWMATRRTRAAAP